MTVTDSGRLRPLLLLPPPPPPPPLLQMYINAKRGRDLSGSRSTQAPLRAAAVQPDRVSLKAPLKSIHASAFEAQWKPVYKLSARAPKGFSPYCFQPLNKLFGGVHQLG